MIARTHAMSSQSISSIRLMTYNVGGGRKDSGIDFEAAVGMIRELRPDILVVQEAVERIDADRRRYSVVLDVANALGFSSENIYFGPALSMQRHFHTSRAIMVQGVFNDWLDWIHGNAMFSRWGFVRLGDSSRRGEPRNIPLFLPLRYEGTRDTDPRYALLARINKAPVYPYVLGTHLSTLRGEGRGEEPEIPGKAEEAQIMRLEQVRHLFDLIKDHLLERNEVVFLLGDFNAVATEPCIASMLKAEDGFVRLIPKNANAPTHLGKMAEPIDHIFVYPSSRLVKYECWIEDTPLASRASDHLPVLADVSVV